MYQEEKQKRDKTGKFLKKTSTKPHAMRLTDQEKELVESVREEAAKRTFFYSVETKDYLAFAKGLYQLGTMITDLIGDIHENFDVTIYYDLEDLKEDFPTFKEEYIGEVIDK